MELATSLGFDVRVVTLPKGQDPADAPAGFEARLAGAESYVHYRVRLELERAPDRQEAFVRAREVLAKVEDSPERQDALRLLADRLELPRETLAGLGARAPDAGRTLVEDLTPKMLEKGARLERNALAACVLHPSLVKLLAEISPEHFDSDLHRRFRAVLVEGGEEDADLIALRAELDARAAQEGLDERTGKELLLNLRERRLRRELAGAELERVKELQRALAKLETALQEIR
jgi:DNA primase